MSLQNLYFNPSQGRLLQEVPNPILRVPTQWAHCCFVSYSCFLFLPLGFVWYLCTFTVFSNDITSFGISKENLSESGCAILQHFLDLWVLHHQQSWIPKCVCLVSEIHGAPVPRWTWPEMGGRLLFSQLSNLWGSKAQATWLLHWISRELLGLTFHICHF